MYFQQYISILIALCNVVPVIAQSPFFKAHQLSEPHRRARIGVVAEDSRGLLWLGTSEGLLSYSGTEYLAYPRPDSTAGAVTAIFSDRQEKRWVGYQDGMICYLQEGRLRQWDPEEGLPAAGITGFAEDAAGRLWIATYGEGLYSHDGRRMYNFDTDDGLLSNDIYVIRSDRKGRIWTGTDSGISICSWNGGDKQIDNITRRDGLPDEIVHALREDDEGNFWIGTHDHGFCYYDVERDSIRLPGPVWENGIVNDLAVLDNQEIWIGTERSGLWRYDLTTERLSPMDNFGEMVGRGARGLLPDSEANIWMVGSAGKLWSANRQFEFIPSWRDRSQCILADGAGRLWLGARDGLYVLDSGNSGASPKEVLADLALNVISLFIDHFGILWVGTFGDGLYCLDPAGNKLRHITEADGLANDNVLSIAGSDREVWLATLGGVSAYSLEQNIIEQSRLSFTNYRKADGLGTDYVYQLLIDSQHRTWLATDGQGLTVIDRGQMTHYRETQNGMALKSIHSITEDTEGDIWFSTAQEGIFEFDGTSFRHIDERKGLRNLSISALLANSREQILIVHPDGVDVLDSRSHYPIHYGEDVGIFDWDVNLNAACIDAEGNALIAAANEIVVFPALRHKPRPFPRVDLESVSVGTELVNPSLDTTFSHRQNYFAFRFRGLWYTNPERVRFRYRLRGNDPDWIETRDRSASYANLLPGTYTFEVAGTIGPEWTNASVAIYRFRIQWPFWQRWWFILLAVGLLSWAIWWWQRQRERRLQRLNLLEQQKIGSELAALKAQINPHFLFNSFNALIDAIEEDPGMAIEYVEQLSDFYRSLLQFRNQQLISLKEELHLIRNFDFLLRKRFGDNFKLRYDLSEEAGMIPPLTLQILVENAVKHNVISKARPLEIDIITDGSRELTVINNFQPKRKQERSTRFGLEGLRKRYELLGGGHLRIERTPTHFSVTVPLFEQTATEV